MIVRTFVKAILLTGFLASPVWAETDTADFGVTLTIVEGCVVTTNDELSFGSHGDLDIARTATVDFTVKCTDGTTGTISLNEGSNSQLGSARYMEDGAGNQIEYNLYTTASHSTPWYTNTVTHQGTGDDTTLTVYGMTSAAGTIPPVGQYSDTIQITVTF